MYYGYYLTNKLQSGLVSGVLKVQVLENGVHSGRGSGIVPSSFRIIRQLLSRIEDEATGEIKLPELFTTIPEERLSQAKRCAEALGENVLAEFTWMPGMKPVSSTIEDAILNSTWRPTLCVTVSYYAFDITHE